MCKGIALGIDLGTINTVMAIDFGDQRGVQVIPNSQNENLTKSLVGLFKGQKIVGSTALDILANDPMNLIHSVKRLMGKGFSDREIQDQIERSSYEIKAPSGGSNDDIRVVLGGIEYSPIEISAMILKKIKEDAEERLNDEIEYATITVPAYFTDKQREATRLAGILAGFKVQILLDEPTAAAIAFGVDQVNEDEMRNIVIYDLGDGTCEVSVLTIVKDIILKLNTEGDMWLGGDIEVELTRDQFEEMIKPQVYKSILIAEKAILGGGLTDNEIDNILLVGEWATIPFIQRTLIERFGEHKILKNIDPMLCIAYGAAIKANRMGERVQCPHCGNINDGNYWECMFCDDLTYYKVPPNLFSLPWGIKTEDDKFSEIIPKNSPYPMAQYLFKEFKVPRSNLKRFKVSVYTGEDEKASQNNHQFTVWLPLPKGTVEGTKLDIGLKLNDNGVVSSVKIKLKDGSGIEKEVFINRDLGLDGQSERGRIEHVIEEIKQSLDQKFGDLKTYFYIKLDDDCKEVIETFKESITMDMEVSRIPIEVEQKIENNLICSNPEWVTKAENLIWWSELTLQKFGYNMDPELNYRIKISIENLKKAIEDNEEEKVNTYYADLDKVTDEIPLYVRFIMRLTINSYRISNMGRSDLSNKIVALISDIDNASKASSIHLLEEKITQAYQIINTFEYIFKKGYFEFVDWICEDVRISDEYVLRDVN